ncbi:TetR family transcriptional regulator [Lachnotalea glycerini]|uniref:TetR family transcriptional regulator n=1 Tax=Lachnotalea glycerini TaxID=1763509 RepID=A0A318EHB0_9FIRM|nr:TetR/AcrR family transcriptional regulator [Lachnotalea glycerini]PXV85676.1 TetR family transcriptional regulator [Lachnotalea glycerini]
MKEKTADRRIRKTKYALKKGLTELMSIKSFKEISVKELTEKVDLNRGTFYLHYKDIFDMVNQIEAEMFEEFQIVLNVYNPLNVTDYPLTLLEDIFKFLKENEAICAALLSANGDIAFIEKLKNIVRAKCFHDWNLLFSKNKADNFEYYFNYMLSGCIGLFSEWLQSGLKESPKEMAFITRSIIIQGINFIK